MFVSVDSETKWSDEEGRQRIETLSIGREDGTSETFVGNDERQAYLWLMDKLSGLYTDAEGHIHRQAPVAFHFGHDTAVLANNLDPRKMFLIRKVQRKIETALCGSNHSEGLGCRYDDESQQDPEHISGVLHRYDPGDVNEVISEGFWGDIIAYDPASHLAFAAAAGQGLYMEHRPSGDRYEKWRRIVVRDTGRAFAGGLESVIESWNPDLSGSQREAIARGKAARATHFVGWTPADLAEYSEAECVAHARVCRKLVDAIKDGAHVAMRPSQLAGSGSVAAAALKHYGAPRRTDAHEDVVCDPLAQMTYFGGMIEAPVVGLLSEDVGGADINSAYPSKMINIPCMRAGHGAWVRSRGSAPAGEIGHVQVTWDVSRSSTSTPPFIVRRKSGAVAQPLIGRRVWATLAEAQMAMKWFPGDVVAHQAYVWEPSCTCEPPLGFLAGLYDYRLSVKSSMELLEPGSPEWEELSCVEQAVKLIINSIYGKLAQSKNGLGPYTNLHFASYVTGATRAQVREKTWEIESAGGTVVYQHTDSVLHVKHAVIDEGKGLGKWGAEKPSKQFLIIQPGLALSLTGFGKKASRGVRLADFIPAAQAWFKSVDLTLHPGKWPKLRTEQSVMISRRQALARGKPRLAGSFETKITESTVVAAKRDYERASPVPGNPQAWKVPPIVFVYDMAGPDDLREFKSRLDQRRQSGEFDLE